MNDCYRTKLGQVIAIQTKYETVARKRIEDELSDPRYHEQVQKTLDAYDTENKSWEQLRKDAAKATYPHWQGGSIRGVKQLDRDIQIHELNIHNLWKNWLQFEDSTPALIAEPKFIDVL